MIHFSDNTEKNDSVERRSFSAIETIVSKKLTVGESRKFWDAVFSTELTVDNAENELLDRLGEVYGRDEDEFNFHFEIDEGIAKILDRFDRPQWDVLTDDKRVEIINLFAHILADRLELNAVPVVVFFAGSPFSLGAFSPDTNYVEINADLLSQPEILKNVISHEMRHAYQYERSLEPQCRMDVLYKINFDNYISPEMSFEDYQDQLVEAEARAFAKLFSSKEAE